MERRLIAAEASRPVVAPTSPVQPASIAPPVSAAAEETEGAVATAPAIEAMPGAVDGDAPQWPDEAAETAFLSDQRTSPQLVLPPLAPERAPEAEKAEANVPLPPLQTLVDKIPAETRDVLEDLFRVKFVSVKRVRPTALK